MQMLKNVNFLFPGYSAVYVRFQCSRDREGRGYILMRLVTEGEVKVNLLSVTRECSVPSITHEISIYITICLTMFLPVAE